MDNRKAGKIFVVAVVAVCAVVLFYVLITVPKPWHKETKAASAKLDRDLEKAVEREVRTANGKSTWNTAQQYLSYPQDWKMRVIGQPTCELRVLLVEMNELGGYDDLFPAMGIDPDKFSAAYRRLQRDFAFGLLPTFKFIILLLDDNSDIMTLGVAVG